jgi:hypothetical protein
LETLDHYRQTVERILSDHAAIPYSFGDIQREVVFDRAHDRYLLMLSGWDRDKRIHGALIHIDIIDGKIWIQRDGTEDGVAYELLEAGIPQERIVPGFRSEARRRDMGFAVA